MRVTTPLVTVFFWLSSLRIVSTLPTDTDSDPAPLLSPPAPTSPSPSPDELFPLGCSSTSLGGGRIALHWVQKDGRCASSQDAGAGARGLFRWDRGTGRPVFVKEEEYREVFWREKKVAGEAR